MLARSLPWRLPYSIRWVRAFPAISAYVCVPVRMSRYVTLARLVPAGKTSI
jgi:hypothetical protein